MHKDDPKLSPWVMVAVIACCALPLLILFGGGSFVLGLLSKNTVLIVFALLLIGVAIWLFFKRKKM